MAVGAQQSGGSRALARQHDEAAKIVDEAIDEFHASRIVSSADTVRELSNLCGDGACGSRRAKAKEAGGRLRARASV